MHQVQGNYKVHTLGPGKAAARPKPRCPRPLLARPILARPILARPNLARPILPGRSSLGRSFLGRSSLGRSSSPGMADRPDIPHGAGARPRPGAPPCGRSAWGRSPGPDRRCQRRALRPVAACFSAGPGSPRRPALPAGAVALGSIALRPVTDGSVAVGPVSLGPVYLGPDHLRPIALRPGCLGPVAAKSTAFALPGDRTATGQKAGRRAVGRTGHHRKEDEDHGEVSFVVLIAGARTCLTISPPTAPLR